MRLSSFIIFIGLGMLLTGGALAVILLYFDPYQARGSIFILFYLSLFLFLAGFFSLVIFGLKKVFLPQKDVWQLMPGSLRQALLLSILVNALLCLQQKQRLAWWSLGMLLAIVVVIEVIFRFKLIRQKS